MNNIEYIVPGLWRDERELLALFTLKNASLFNDNRQIRGLNFGLNTNQDKAIVKDNRELLYDIIGIDEHKIAMVHQVHGNRVVYAKKSQSKQKADALVTDRSYLALAIKVADCAAVLLADRENRIIGAAHAGWRGAVSGVIANTVGNMLKLGADVDQIEAYVSPCICQQKFEVGEEVAEQFDNEFVDRKNYTKPHVNLKGYIKKQLTGEGIKDENIDVDSGCTITDEDKFYSYRREKDNSGRMLALIMLR